MQKFQRQQVTRLPPQVVEKWSSAVLTEGFVPFPKKLVRCLHRIFRSAESIKDLAVILAVVDFKRPNLSRPPSLAYLAFLAGLEVDEFQAALDRLKDKSYIKVSGDSEGLDIALDGLLQVIEAETKE